MEPITVKYHTYDRAVPPQPIRIKVGGWGGTAEKMQDGAAGQPWHCLPFVEASTYGLELLYPYETECHVVSDQGTVRFEWDYAREPGGGLTGGEFIAFAPKRASRYYLFNARLDLVAPPGHVLRTEPHPRFFTDDTGTVPLAMIGHLQQEWYPRLLFVVFRAPPPGQRHVFRKGEPYAQLLFVPDGVDYHLVELTPEEAERRRELEAAMAIGRQQLADHRWQDCDGAALDNHYKVLAGAFARGGAAAVAEAVRQALARHEQALPTDKSIPECLILGSQLVGQRKYREASAIYSHVLSREPDNPEALSHLGICVACLGNVELGLDLMGRAVAREPRWPRYHSNLGEMLRLFGRYCEAEASFRASLHLNPSDPGIWSVLGLTLAQQGRPDEGLQACQTALSLNHALPAAHYRLGAILAQCGRYAEARSSYEMALFLDANYADARHALQSLPATPQ
jgi:Flp pilus assembly protein TadD